MSEFVRMKGPDGQERLAMIISAGSYEVDTNGRPLLRVIDGAPWAYDAANDLLKTTVARRESVTIQTHTAQNVVKSGSANGTVQTAIGYDSVAVGLRSDASHSRRVEVEWYADAAGVTLIGFEVIVATASQQTGVGRTTVKGPYFKVALKNEDAATDHVMNSWTTLIP